MAVYSASGPGLSPLEQGDIEGEIPVYGWVPARTNTVQRVVLLGIAAQSGR